MARYIGPKCKLSRREGRDLLLKVVLELMTLNVNLKLYLASMAEAEDLESLTTVCS